MEPNPDQQERTGWRSRCIRYAWGWMLAGAMPSFQGPNPVISAGLCLSTTRSINQAVPNPGHPLNFLTLANPYPYQEFSFYRVSWGRSRGSSNFWLEKNRTEPKVPLGTTGQNMLQCFLPSHSTLQLLFSLAQSLSSVWSGNQILLTPLTFENTLPSNVVPFKPRLWGRSLLIFKPLSGFRIGCLSEHPQFIISNIQWGGKDLKKKKRVI